MREQYLFIFALCFFLLLHCLSFVLYVNDDAYITFRYSRNLATGEGAVYNPGERVEGYTNTLWMLLFAFFHLFKAQLPVAVIGKLLGILFALGTLWFTIRCSLTLHPARAKEKKGSSSWPQLYLLAPLLVALSPPLAVNAMSTLETLPFTFLLTWGLYLELRQLTQGRSSLSGLIFGLAALCRPEGFAFFFFVLLARSYLLVSQPRTSFPLKNTLINLGLFLLLTIPYVVIRYLYYDHQLLPNTYWAKQGGFNPGLEYLLMFFIRNGLFLFPIFIVVSLFWGENRQATLFIFWFQLAAYLGIMGTGGDWMIGYRLLVPVIPAIALSVQEGVAVLWSGERLKLGVPQQLVRVAVIIVLSLALIRTGVYSVSTYNYVNARGIGYHKGHLQLARWLQEQPMLPEDKIALMDIGIVGYFLTPQPILDLTGLTDRFIAKSPGLFLRKRYDPNYVLNQRPLFIILVDVVPPRVTGERAQVIPNMWTRMEYDLFSADQFQKNYGLVRYFEHIHPSQGYYLLVFKRTS